MLKTFVFKRIGYFKNRYSTNTGFVVLIPEIGEDSHFNEKKWNSNELPKFNKITIEDCLGAIGQQALFFEASIKEVESDIVNKGINIENIFEKIEKETAPLDETWGIAKTLYLGNNTLIPTKSYMNVHNRALSARVSKFTNKIIYTKLKNEYQKSNELLQDSQKKRLVEKYLLEGKLNGLEINRNRRDELKETIIKLNSQREIFKKKVDTATNSFGHVIEDYNMIRSFPKNLLETVAVNAYMPTKGPWKINLQPKIVETFLKHCPDRTERWNVWQASVRKCSTQLDKNLETSTHIEMIRSLRKKQANILGYSSYTEMSMETKMIKSAANAKTLFTNLLQSAGPAQSVEIENLQRFAMDCGFGKKLEIYDVPYWNRKYLETNYDLNEEKIKQYFPLTKVIKELFNLTEQIFAVKIVQRSVEVWQPTVKYFDVFDCDFDTKQPVGGFYLDCYSNEATIGRNLVYLSSIRNKNKTAGSNPLCALIFNFKKTTLKEKLLYPEELHTLFKAFGTGMQHILTRAVYSDLAGLSNIEWDASEITGEVMANFLYNKKTLKQISSHFETEDSIPSALLNKMILLKTGLGGYTLCEEIYYSDLDLELHQSNEFWLDLVKKLWPVYRCMSLNKVDAHPCSMVDIFSGDWAAAYFSHLHSKVIAADVFDAFLNEKSNDSIAQIGKRYKETFLSLGGSVATAEVFRRFRGRDPSVEALLKSLNLLECSYVSTEETKN